MHQRPFVTEQKAHQRPPRSTKKRKTHLLKNGHPAHVFTDEDRRKGAERTNAIKRARRQAFEDEKLERAIAEMVAVDEARRARRHERYLRQRAEAPPKVLGTLQQPVAKSEPGRAPYEADVSGYGEPDPDQVAIWLERGYGAVVREPPD